MECAPVIFHTANINHLPLLWRNLTIEKCDGVHIPLLHFKKLPAQKWDNFSRVGWVVRNWIAAGGLVQNHC
jgi:hypothetical protein